MSFRRFSVVCFVWGLLLLCWVLVVEGFAVELVALKHEHNTDYNTLFAYLRGSLKSRRHNRMLLMQDSSTVSNTSTPIS